MAAGVMTLGALVGETNEETSNRARLIYWRLIDIIMKIDNIDGE
jgi:hypothetical protein